MFTTSVLQRPFGSPRRSEAQSSRTTRRFQFETLDSRELLSADFSSVFALAGTRDQNALAVAVDTAGDHIVVGSFSGVVDLDPDPVSTFNVTARTGTTGSVLYHFDMYAAKYAPDGTLRWAHAFPAVGTPPPDSTTSVQLNKLALDSAGNVWALGNADTAVTIDLGSGIFIDTASTSSFLLKLDGTTGQTLSARGFTGGSPQSIYVDSSNALFIGGSFTANTFDVGGQVFTRQGSGDGFVAKYTVGGQLSWARQFPGSMNVDGSITTDTNGNVVFGGTINGRTDFDPGPAAYLLTNGQGHWSSYVVKLNSSGNFVWASNFENRSRNSFNSPSGVMVDVSGNVFVGGSFYNDVDFATGKSVYKLTGETSIYLVKLAASSGLLSWAQEVVSGTETRGVRLGAGGQTYVTGYFSGTLDFDPGTAVHSLTASDGNDVFVVRYRPDGTYDWAVNLGADFPQGLAVTPGGDLIVSGCFSGTTDFDPSSGTASLTSVDRRDAFVVKLHDSGPSPVTSGSFDPLRGAERSTPAAAMDAVFQSWSAESMLVPPARMRRRVRS